MTAVISKLRDSELTVTDQFCGAGGSSIGATAAGASLKLAMNHWKLAIETHNSNFPDAAHACADISSTDPRRYRSTDILITSPECTNHTKAKNRPKGPERQPQLWDKRIDEERSRATMWDVPRFAEVHDYQVIIVENVIEAAQWTGFPAWLHAMDDYGYDGRPVFLNSMIAAATGNLVQPPQSRDRMYYVWWKKGNRAPKLDFDIPAVCATHGTVMAYQQWKPRKAAWPLEHWGKYRSQYLYACPECHKAAEPVISPALAAIDWTIQGDRIGDRADSLKPATLDRIRRGLEKYGNLEPLIIQTAGHCFEREGYVRAWPGSLPLPVQTATLSHGLLVPVDGREGKGCRPLTDPGFTQTGRQELGVAYQWTPFVAELRGGGSNERSVRDPLCTVEAGGNHHLLCHPPAFYVKNYGDGSDPSMAHEVTEPFGVVTATDHHSIVTMPMPFVTEYNGNGGSHAVVEPLGTQPTHDRFGLVEPSSPPKLDDCRFRMLVPHEIQRAMAFPDDYVVLGTQRDRVRQLGNAVTPPIMAMLFDRVVESLDAA